mgnify:CR=1 FL=1
MDGFASTVSPLILDGKKITKPAVYPAAILADTSIMKDAPMPMLTAGFGDIIGKYTALADWRLSRDLNGEYYCEECAALMARAVEKCAENAGGLRRRDEQAVEYVTEALVLSGIAMGMVGNSRPASGAEHHFAHTWEVDALARGEEHPCTAIPWGWRRWSPPPCTSWRRTCCPRASSGRTRPASFNVWRRRGPAPTPRPWVSGGDLFFESVLHAMEIRERFTILRFLDGKALLPACAVELTNRFYPA